jgi:uncharacterized membrane protein
MIDQRLEPVEALRASSRLTAGSKGQLVLFGLTLVGVNLLGALAFGVGLLFTVPTCYLAAGQVFRQLQGHAPTLEHPAAPPPIASSPAA